jgi:hypothetical protein
VYPKAAGGRLYGIVDDDGANSETAVVVGVGRPDVGGFHGVDAIRTPAATDSQHSRLTFGSHQREPRD